MIFSTECILNSHADILKDIADKEIYEYINSSSIKMMEEKNTMLESFEYEYEPNSIDSDQFLSEVSINLTKENIKAQFRDPLEYRKKDHITPFITKYKFSQDNADAYEDEDMDNVIELRDDFYAFIQRMLRDYLSIGFVDFDDMSNDEQDKLIHLTYRFFLINIKRNFVSLIMNYINKNRDSYEDADDDKRRDVTSLSFKREITDPIDIHIISNLHSIIIDILDEDITVEDFFDNCDNDGCLETLFVKEKFENFEITGNFVPHYIRMLDDDFISDIETKIRNKILKKYRKVKPQKVEIPPEEVMDVE